MPFASAPTVKVAPDAGAVTSNRDVIFVHVQKTGGTSILKALGQEMHPRHKHCFASEFQRMYTTRQWNGAFKFAFVRNPWDRLVSWWSMIDTYRDAFRRGARLNCFFTYVFENSTTFEEFILNCHADIDDADGRKCIMRNQLDYVTDSDGHIIVDYIGRFENLDADFGVIARQLGLPDIRLEHRNRSSRSAYAGYYNARTRTLVETAYERDIACFGYSFGNDAG